MPPITWKNITTPDFSGVSDTLAAAGESFDRSTSALDKVLKGHTDRINRNWDAKAKRNTQDLLRQRQNITDLGEAKAAIAGPLPESVGIQVDDTALKTGSDTILDKIRSRLTGEAAAIGEATAMEEQSPTAGITAYRQTLVDAGMAPDQIDKRVAGFQSGRMSELQLGWDEETDDTVMQVMDGLRNNPNISEADANQQVLNLAKERNLNTTRTQTAATKLKTMIKSARELSDDQKANIAMAQQDLTAQTDDYVAAVTTERVGYDQLLATHDFSTPGMIRQADEIYESAGLTQGDPIDQMMEQVGDGGIIDNFMRFNFIGLFPGGEAQYGDDAKKILRKADNKLREYDGLTGKDRFRILMATFDKMKSQGKDITIADGSAIHPDFVKEVANQAVGAIDYAKLEYTRNKLAALEKSAPEEYQRDVANAISTMTNNAASRNIKGKNARVQDPTKIIEQSRTRLTDQLRKITGKVGPAEQGGKKNKPGSTFGDANQITNIGGGVNSILNTIQNYADEPGGVMYRGDGSAAIPVDIANRAINKRLGR